MQSRNTKSKSLVLQLLQQSKTPLTLQELFTYVQQQQPTVAYSTIFRIVRDLSQSKKLIQIDWKERGSRYEWAERTHHHHLVCNNCHAVADIQDDELQLNLETVTKNTGFSIQDHSIELFGVCQPCQTK
jgi:Fur family transcriptional regulator, ferric uptake regulator